jgi:4-hydroxy-3-polyprenylbenzoate decarboxylase
MNAMWGAGQMMFNKILVLADEGVKIQDYESLAKYVFKNLNPATDIYFSTGPMDVLDHSCSKMGFGGKMCIDGTAKMEEETDDNYFNSLVNSEWLKGLLEGKFPEITALNAYLLKIKIPCLIISVKKNRPGHIKELHEQLCTRPELDGVKMILYIEHTVDANDLPTALWRFCNNLDPKRDYHLCKRPSPDSRLKSNDSYIACMGLDGTRKTKKYDNFQRDWPNILVANEVTIKSIDEKWHELGIGEFIPSPSLKYKDQQYGEEAVVS